MSHSSDVRSLVPRVVRAVPDPLALYIRASRNDQKVLLDLLTRRDANFFGVVVEATSTKAQRELREQVVSHRLDLILDPRTLASATPGGYSDSIGKLPWGLPRPHVVDDFMDVQGRKRSSEIASFAVANGFSQIFAPTHLINSSSDKWLDADIQNVRHLRNALDRANASHIEILYSLSLPYMVFRDEHEREQLIDRLESLPVTAIWLQIDGLGAQATPTGVRNYISNAAAFKRLNMPIIADGMGGVAGLAVLGFGAAGGLAHGVTFGERVDHSSWKRPRTGSSFGPKRRVYLRDMDLFMEPEDAAELLKSSTRASSLLSCHDTHCCPRGSRDMLEDPGRHFLVQRMRQMQELSRIPSNVRPSQFIENFFRPASDNLLRASNWSLPNADVERQVNKQRRRLDALRIALGNDVEAARRRQVVLPRARRSRDHRVGV